jgi:uncharacterized protein YqjF (DUF2071 family)
MILTDHTDHRPFSIPNSPWVMHQAWNDFLFMHWPVPVEQIRAAVPEPLPLHLHEGVAYLGVIPFHMTDVRPRGTVNVPGLSNFPELNVRTYVIVDGKPGVYFLSLDASNRVAVETARATFGLPYFKATMHWERNNGNLQYYSARTDRRGPPAELKGSYRPTGDYFYTAKGTLQHWLSERYRLYTVDGQGQIYTTDVHHLPWPMRNVEASFSINTMAQGHGIDLPDEAPLVHYSPGVDVVVWAPRREATYAP